MKKLVAAVFFIIISGMIVLPFVLIIAGIQQTPLCQKDKTLSYDDIQAATAVINRIKPDNAKRKQLKTTSVSEKELNLLLNYGFSHGLSRIPVASNLKLSTDHINTAVTINTPPTPWGNFFNMGVDFIPRKQFLQVHAARFGSINIPGYLINPVANVFHLIFMRFDLYADIFNSLSPRNGIRINNGVATITYDWDPSAIKQLHESGKAVLLSREKQQRLLSYHNELAAALSGQSEKKISLARIIKPLFAYAAGQADISGKPVLENTALLQILALYVTGTGLDTFIQEDLVKTARPLKRTTLVLKNRNDLSQHFLVSAALSVSTDALLSNLIGVAKEVDDSDGGSGFSFPDLAADRAGTRFGSSAIASPSKARQFQKKMMSIKNEQAFMPPIDNLPEGLTRLQFKQRFKDLDSEAYAAVIREIDNRINNCEIYR